MTPRRAAPRRNVPAACFSRSPIRQGCPTSADHGRRAPKHAVAARGLSLAATIAWHARRAQASTATAGDLGRSARHGPGVCRRVRCLCVVCGVCGVVLCVLPGSGARQRRLSRRANGRLVRAVRRDAAAVEQRRSRRRALPLVHGGPARRASRPGIGCSSTWGSANVRTRCSPSARRRDEQQQGSAAQRRPGQHSDGGGAADATALRPWPTARAGEGEQTRAVRQYTPALKIGPPSLVRRLQAPGSLSRSSDVVDLGPESRLPGPVCVPMARKLRRRRSPEAISRHARATPAHPVLDSCRSSPRLCPQTQPLPPRRCESLNHVPPRTRLAHARRRRPVVSWRRSPSTGTYWSPKHWPQGCQPALRVWCRPRVDAGDCVCGCAAGAACCCCVVLPRRRSSACSAAAAAAAAARPPRCLVAMASPARRLRDERLCVPRRRKALAAAPFVVPVLRTRLALARPRPCAWCWRQSRPIQSASTLGTTAHANAKNKRLPFWSCRAAVPRRRVRSRMLAHSACEDTVSRRKTSKERAGEVSASISTQQHIPAAQWRQLFDLAGPAQATTPPLCWCKPSRRQDAELRPGDRVWRW
jgi:hypothetical protein